MHRRMYKNQKLAYQIEIGTALLTLIAIGMFGEIGIAALAVIALRPALLDRIPMTAEALRFHNSTGITGIVITFLTLLVYYISSEYIFNVETDWRLTVILIFPYFLLSHGIAGLIYHKFKFK